jgi:predicted RNA-binding Zn-ribbon protein involved in translation (DUF1610 family)
MGVLQKIKNGLYCFMYGRNGMDQLNLALMGFVLALDLVTMLLQRRLAVLSGVLYWVAIGLWILVLFRLFSKNLYKRREENSKFLNLAWRVKSQHNGAKARHADKAHKYFTCKSCKTICRVPVGKGKIVITCPKCGAQIHARS